MTFQDMFVTIQTVIIEITNKTETIRQFKVIGS